MMETAVKALIVATLCAMLLLVSNSLRAGWWK
jgi:hypothetical protein